jgi:hypothetical protein
LKQEFERFLSMIESGRILGAKNPSSKPKRSRVVHRKTTTTLTCEEFLAGRRAEQQQAVEE